MEAEQYNNMSVSVQGFPVQYRIPSKLGTYIRKEIETHIIINCNVMRLTQRCTDWFLNEILISGTMECIITSKLKKEPQPCSTYFLNSVLNMCKHSRLLCHKYNAAMIDGTLNEHTIFDKLHHELFILDLLEVGLLSVKPNRLLASHLMVLR